MSENISDKWFYLGLATVFGLCLLFVAVVVAAPHDDIKMRGFAPCTGEMVSKLQTASFKRDVWGVFSAVGKSYLCYGRVMANGWRQWTAGKQTSPWANYLFEAENFEIPAKESEPLSADLLKANLFDDSRNSTDLWLEKENDNERK